MVANVERDSPLLDDLIASVISLVVEMVPIREIAVWIIHVAAIDDAIGHRFLFAIHRCMELIHPLEIDSVACGIGPKDLVLQSDDR